jgi:hypothetical protein
MVEITASRELETGAETEVDVVPELQVTLSTRQHIRVLGGIDVPVTQRDTRDVAVLFYVLWDFADGGLLEGW